MTATEENEGDSPSSAKKIPPLLKLLLELGPLAVFFTAFQYGKSAGEVEGLLFATGFFLVALVISNAVTYAMTGALSRMTLFVTILALTLGGLTLALGDETFLQMRPTVVNFGLGAILVYGLWRGRSYLQYLMGELFPMREEGWLKLTRNWAIYFFCMSAFNELVWRTQDIETWVWAKTFVYLPITFIFTLSQTPLMTRYAIEEDESASTPSEN